METSVLKAATPALKRTDPPVAFPTVSVVIVKSVQVERRAGPLNNRFVTVIKDTARPVCSRGPKTIRTNPCLHRRESRPRSPKKDKTVKGHGSDKHAAKLRIIMINRKLLMILINKPINIFNYIGTRRTTNFGLYLDPSMKWKAAQRSAVRTRDYGVHTSQILLARRVVSFMFFGLRCPRQPRPLTGIGCLRLLAPCPIRDNAMACDCQQSLVT